MADTAPPSAGYAPATGVLATIEKMRQGTVSGPVDRDFLKRIGVPDSLTKRTMNSLQALGLIDNTGKVTSSFSALIAARPNEYESQLANFVKAAYSDIFAIADPATATPEQLRNAFWGYEPRGQIDNMIRLFLSLCAEAGLVDQRPKVERVSGPPKPRKTATKNNGNKDTAADKKTDEDPAFIHPPAPPDPPEIDPTILAWIKRMPRTDEPWPQDRKERWFAALRAMADDIWPDGDKN